ncbi:MAG TPA: acetylornithine/succinylornithine family transaminase [Polyangiaceae bacterium]|nr:acetylornithine/succinylornithine family transaminase [Polyangiaceae bacterium]
MRSIASLEASEAKRLRVFAFDLDDTLLTDGVLERAAYDALFTLRDAGLSLVAVTGRPLGFAEVLARQWPVLGVVAENGAVACLRRNGRLEVVDFAGDARKERSAELAGIVRTLRERFPSLVPSDDAHLRRSDFTFDIAEHERVPRGLVDAAERTARTLGARTVTSSVHLHVTLDGLDKASGTARFLARALGMDPTETVQRTAFIGDSENDAACFAAFRTTLAVRNLRGRPTVSPRFVTRAEKGEGFAEAAARIAALRGLPGRAGDLDRAAPEGMVRERFMSATQAELVESAARTLYPNYRQPPLVLERGKGTEVWDAAGKRYLDLAAGIAVSSLGHGHPALVAAIAEQAAKLIHVSNYFYNRTNVELAARLTRVTKMDRVFFCNSGTEALEACLKLARRHFHAKGQTERFRVIAFEQSFHGRTLGALAATGQKAYREGFGPMGGVTHVPYGDVEKVRAAMGPDVAAILAEPVQGEGGVLPAPAGFLAALRKIADESGALLVADEVQTGVGRTGRFLAVEHAGVEADVVALAKGLGGGVPIGAMLVKEKLADALPPGSHGSTFGGNALASAAALAVLDTLDEERLIPAATEKGEHLARLLASLAARHEKSVEGARGLGLLQALVLRESVDARAVVGSLRDAGVLVTVAGSRALRFSPPLTVSLAELDEGASIVDRVLSSL